MGESQSKLTPEDLADLQKSTYFTQEELNSWYEDFMRDYPNGRLSREDFTLFCGRFFPSGDPSQFAEYLFDVFDTNQNDEIDFKEFIIPLSLTSRGTQDNKLKWVFQLFDIDNDGNITKGEMLQIVESVYKMVGQMVELADDEDTAEKRVNKIFPNMDKDKNNILTYDEFIDGSKQDPAIAKALTMCDGFV